MIKSKHIGKKRPGWLGMQAILAQSESKGHGG
jgi:hypothetical protein